MILWQSTPPLSPSGGGVEGTEEQREVFMSNYNRMYNDYMTLADPSWDEDTNEELGELLKKNVGD